MAERVTIKINVNADTDAIDRTEAKLARLAATAEIMDSRLTDMSDSSSKLNKDFMDLDKEVQQKSKDFNELSGHVDKTDKKMSKMSKNLNKQDGLSKTLRKFGEFGQKMSKLFLKAVGVNILGVATSLLAVEAAFRVGAVAARMWNSTVQATKNVAAGAAASLLVVMSTLAAGSREFAAAQQATKYRQSGALGAGTNEAMGQLRGFEKNAKMAVLGADAIRGAFAAISSKTQSTGVLQQALAAMADFSAVSADPAKSLAAAGTFLGELKKNGKLTEQALDAAVEVGPEFANAIVESVKKGVTSSDGIMKALMAGDMSGAVSGALEAQNNTLFGTFKRNFELIKADFADVGQTFLPAMTQNLERVANILTGALTRLAPSLADFGKGSAIDGLVDGLQRAVDWGVTFTQKTLPNTDGMFGRIGDRIQGIGDTLSSWRESFRGMADALRPLRDGAKVLMDAFGPLLKGFFTEFAGGVSSFSDLLVKNKDKIDNFGQGLLKLFHALSEMSGAIKETIVALLPVLDPILDVATKIVTAIAKVTSSLTSMGEGGAMAAVGVLAAGYIGMGKMGKGGGLLGKLGRGVTGGGGMSSVGAMTVNAGTVYVNGADGTPGSPGAAGGSRYGAKGKIGQGAIGQLASILAITYGASALADPKAGVGRSALGGAAVGAGVGLQMGGPMGALGGAAVGGVAGAGVGVGGAVGGALAGAAIGSVLIPIPVVGTAVGALVGGIGGYFLSERKKTNEYKKNAKESAISNVEAWALPAAELLSKGSTQDALKAWDQSSGKSTQMNQALTSLFDSKFKGEGLDRDERVEIFNGPDGDIIRKLIQRGVMSGEDANAFLDAPGEFTKNMKKGLDSTFETFYPIFSRYTSNMNDLEDATGQGADAISSMAESLGVDLAGLEVDFKSLMEGLTGRDISDNGTDLGFAIDGMASKLIDSIVNVPTAKQKAQEAVDQGGETLREMALGGTMTAADTAQYFKDATTFFSTQNYDAETGMTDWMQVGKDMKSYLGQGGYAYKDGEQFSGESGTLIQDALAPFLSQYDAGMGKLAGRAILDTIQQMAFKSGINFDQTGITDSSLASLDSGGIAKLVALTKEGGFGQSRAGAQDIDKVFSSLGLSGGVFRGNVDRASMAGEGAREGVSGAWSIGESADPGSAIESALIAGGTATSSAITSAGASASSGMSSAIASAGGFAASAMAGAIRGAAAGLSVSVNVSGGGPVYGPPTPPQPGQLGYQKGDTSSERFSRTMAKHNRVSDGLSGKRTITSGMRSDNLGSLNSDHLTGGALDVTGDNLGAYANMINGSGGFAEFHGSGADRHLHTVPGPYGDSAMPASMPALPPSSSSVNGGGGGNMIQVFPSAGMDEEALANLVIAKMGRKQRSARERMNL